MALRPTSYRVLRINLLRPSPTHILQSSWTKIIARHASANSQPPPNLPDNPLDPIARQRHELAHREYYKRKMKRSALGFAGCVAGMVVVCMIISSQEKSKMDSGPVQPSDPMSKLGKDSKVLVQSKDGNSEASDQIATGTSTIPTFPRVIEYADVEGENWKQEGLLEYQLMGLGVRTVSFLGIEVYVVGIYVATDDIATLQQRLIRKIDPVATTLVAGEKENLKQQLLDGERSEQIWNEVLKDGGIRTVIRIVPCRNTNFHHMRDAWVRALKARAQKSPDEYSDESFGLSVQQFQVMLSGGGVHKGKEMLLGRGKKGDLSVWFEEGRSARRLGGLEDERISRAVWLNYLGGKSVASEKARASVVDGVMEFVERPVGTVATQVHV